jgi:ABC-type transport system substrate-binding protein
MKKSVLFLLLLVGVVSIFVAACGGGNDNGGTATESEVIVAIGSDPGDLGPFVGMSMGRIAVLNTMYEFLLAGETPVIAESFEETEGGPVVVPIRKNVVDSAGNAITAADVAWSYNSGMTAGNLQPLGNIESVKATGDYTVEFVFKAGVGGKQIEQALGECPIVSQKAFEASTDKFATKPISTSAYMVTESVPGSSITFAKNPSYWQTDEAAKSPFAKQNIEQIVFQVITEPAQHSVALETGTVDISATVAAADTSRFEGNPKFIVSKFLDNLTQCLMFNGTEGNPFTKLELRQAVAYAVDKDAVGLAAAGKNSYAVAHTIGNRNFNGYEAKWDSEPYYDFDLAKAKELFTASGATAGMTAKLLVMNAPADLLVAQVIQSQLKALGITVTMSQQERAVYEQAMFDPTAYDLLIRASAGGEEAYSPMRLIYSATMYEGKTSNWFVDAKLQELLSAAEAGSTPENLDALVQYDKSQVYALGLLSYQNNAVSVSGVTKVVTDERGQIIPGACEYASDFK